MAFTVTKPDPLGLRQICVHVGVATIIQQDHCGVPGAAQLGTWEPMYPKWTFLHGQTQRFALWATTTTWSLVFWRKSIPLIILSPTVVCVVQQSLQMTSHSSRYSDKKNLPNSYAKNLHRGRRTFISTHLDNHVDCTRPRSRSCLETPVRNRSPHLVWQLPSMNRMTSISNLKPAGLPQVDQGLAVAQGSK